jgi:hypothetical protein
MSIFSYLMLGGTQSTVTKAAPAINSEAGGVLARRPLFALLF